MDIFDKFTETVTNIAQPEDKILDIGTGDGLRLRTIVNSCTKLDKMMFWTGIDISERQIAKAILNFSNYNNVFIQIGDGYGLDCENAYFDIVIGTKSCFCPEEAFRVLKPGGYYFYIGAGNEDWIELRRLFGYVSKAYLTKATVYNKLVQTGYQILKYEDYLATEHFTTRDELIDFFSTGYIVPHNTAQELSEQIKKIEKYFEPLKEILLTSHEWFTISLKPSPSVTI